MPLNFWHQFIPLTHNIQTLYLLNIWSPLPRYPDNKFQIVPFILYSPLELKIVFVEIWLEMSWILGQTYGTFMYEGLCPLPDGISLS